jgi:hypothetical protein
MIAAAVAATGTEPTAQAVGRRCTRPIKSRGSGERTAARPNSRRWSRPCRRRDDGKVRPRCHHSIAPAGAFCSLVSLYPQLALWALQPRQRRPEPSPQRKLWKFDAPCQARAAVAAKEPWHVQTVADGRVRVVVVVMMPRCARDSTILAPLPGLFSLLLPITHSLRCGLGSNAATAAEDDRD